MSLEQQAEDRKKRLSQLRGVKRNSDQVDQGPSHPSSRNYDQETRSAKLGYDEQPEEETVEVVAEEVQQEALEKLRQSTTSKLEYENLQPKRANWDLKRDLEPQLSVLETRTDNAIYQIVRERLQKSMDESGKVN